MLSLSHDRRLATKFCTHIRIDLGMVSNLNKIDLPTKGAMHQEGGGRRGNLRGLKSENVMNCRENQYSIHFYPPPHRGVGVLLLKFQMSGKFHEL